jgi:sugar phosphate isomerase/epimerase
MRDQTLEITMKLKLDAVESVTVPKGTFDNCLKLVNTTKFGDREFTRTVWYAKGVGTVKTETQGPNGQVATGELVDYKLAAPKYDESGAEKLGWKLAIQAWTNNQATLYETLELAQRLGLHYLEAFPGQRLSKDLEGGMGPGMSDEQIKGLLDKAEACGVKIVNFGVTGVPGDEPGARGLFEWAKKIGLETIVTEPGEDNVATLDKLAGEFDMKIAIHNHPQPSHYWNPETVLAAVPGASPRVGACADTGHWVRSGLDPVECIKKLEGRVVSLHFKDISARTGDMHDVIWGTGASDAAGQLAALKAEGFKGVFSIEYEHQWSEADLVKCAEFFFAEANKLAAK